LVIGQWGVGALALLASCRSVPPAVLVGGAGAAPAVRFLLTFDDGPSIRQPFNPTVAIMDQLATNDVQPGIKALFFVQTGHPRGGGTPRGRAIMRRIHEQGHVIGLHSVSPRGHVSHTVVPADELARSLQGAQDLIREIAGSAPPFVRPPFGAWNQVTRAVYAEQGLRVLMADVRGRDGIIYGYRGSLFRRVHVRRALAAIKRTAEPGGAKDGPLAVILEFHDLNPYTARHMTEYLHILVEEARRTGWRVPEKPFYDEAEALAAAALCRTVREPSDRRRPVRMAAAQPNRQPAPESRD